MRGRRGVRVLVHEYDPDDALAASALTIAFIYQLALRELVPVERLPAGCTGDPKWHGAASREFEISLVSHGRNGVTSSTRVASRQVSSSTGCQEIDLKNPRRNSLFMRVLS